MADKSNLIYTLAAGPIIIGAAYGAGSLLLGEASAAGAGGSDMSLAYGLLLWVGTPIVLIATLPLFGGILKIFTRS